MYGILHAWASLDPLLEITVEKKKSNKEKVIWVNTDLATTKSWFN